MYILLFFCFVDLTLDNNWCNKFIVQNMQVTAMLSLAAACSSAGVVVLYAKDLNFCMPQNNLACHSFEVSVILAFITWLLIALSSHVMFWILASV